jgi:hypothetical protein
MEFGFLTQGYVPQYLRDIDPDAEHTVLMDDLETVSAEARVQAHLDIEHHFLTNTRIFPPTRCSSGVVRMTKRAHWSGIFNPLPQVNHPAKVAERVAMLDHLTEGRFEFGTGRGAGSHEVTGFHDELIGTDVSETKEIWEEMIGEFVKMWLQEEYEGFQGKYWSMPPRKILPKPWKKPHPPMVRRRQYGEFRDGGARNLVSGVLPDHLDVTERR